MLGNVCTFLYVCSLFFKIYFFKQKKSGTLSEVSNGLDPDQGVLSVMIEAQTVCKNYKQTTKVDANNGKGSLVRFAISVHLLTRWDNYSMESAASPLLDR